MTSQISILFELCSKTMFMNNYVYFISFVKQHFKKSFIDNNDILFLRF